MKKIYTLLSALALTFTVSAQTNLDFETWTNSTTCTGWTTASAADSISQVTTPLPTIEGASSMLIANTDAFQDGGGSDSLGGSFVYQAITVVPDSLHISVMPTMMGTDTARVGVDLYNGATYQGSLLGEYAAADNPTPGSYYVITVDLTQGGVPAFDNIAVWFYSSKTPSNAGSFIVVDDVRIYEPSQASIGEEGLNAINVYPNPATDNVNFNLGNNDVDQIVIVDISGRIVDNIQVTGSLETLATSDYQNGVYFYQIITNDEVVKTDKFVVSK
jgi:hypothetical protein